MAADAPAPAFQPGDAVFGIMPPMVGAFAEFVACPATQLSLKPSRLSFAQAAVLPIPGLTVVGLPCHVRVSGEALCFI